MTARFLAREWLWLIAVVVPVFVLTLTMATNGFDEFWYGVAFFYVPITLVRLTIWAVRTLRAARAP